MKCKTAIQEFVEKLFDESRYGVDLMTIDDARDDLKAFRQEGWDLPEGITPEKYSEIWNNLVKEQNSCKEENTMKAITVDEWKHIEAGRTIYNGFGADTCTAPKEPGLYTLYELVYDNNTHAGFRWEKEKEAEKMKKENTITIYANYGVLAAEKRTVYSERPVSEAFDQLTVKIPDGWGLYETVTGSKALTAPWGGNYSINEVLAGDKNPMFIVIDDVHKEHRIKLEEVKK